MRALYLSWFVTLTRPYSCVPEREQHAHPSRVPPVDALHVAERGRPVAGGAATLVVLII